MEKEKVMKLESIVLKKLIALRLKEGYQQNKAITQNSPSLRRG